MPDLRVAVIVSKDKSDLYFANQLMQRLNVVGVIVENQKDERPVAVRVLGLLGRPHVLMSKLWNKIVNAYRRINADYDKPEYSAEFGEEGYQLFPRGGVEVLYTQGVNRINDPEYVEWLRRLKPDVVAVCGASILRDEILSAPSLGALNLHGGLSQRYRGLFTTDWAVFNEEPEYIGATVHYITAGIDDGDIVYQGRPVVEAQDNPHSLYVKVVKLGVTMMEQAIIDLEEGKLISEPLQEKGRLYMGKMYDDRVRFLTWKKLRKGIMQSYLSNRLARDRPVRQMMTCIHPKSV